MTDLTGRTLGPYELHEEIGHGGMANVYRAVQPSIGREVAVKVLPAHFLQDRTFVERFTREVKVIAKLQHSHILPVYDFGEQDGIPYIVMAYMPGGTLADRIRREGGLPLDEVARLVEQIAAGLDFAHKKGVIHRDFKPSNVLLDEAGNVHLADFGIAKVTEATAQLTGSGIVGTPAYMAPEMGTPEGLSPLVDVYALGVTLYQMLTGRQPYEAPTPLGVLMAHANQPIPDARALRPDLPDAAQAVVEGAMAKDPAERYQSAGALAADLRAAVTSSIGAQHVVPLPSQPAEADTPDTELAPPMVAEAAPDARTMDVMETPRPTQPSQSATTRRRAAPATVRRIHERRSHETETLWQQWWRVAVGLVAITQYSVLLYIGLRVPWWLGYVWLLYVPTGTGSLIASLLVGLLAIDHARSQRWVRTSVFSVMSASLVLSAAAIYRPVIGPNFIIPNLPPDLVRIIPLTALLTTCGWSVLDAIGSRVNIAENTPLHMKIIGGLGIVAAFIILTVLSWRIIVALYLLT